mmetsp:Transcript_7679/g.26037  ORF Transcript_7679/g.26037 Transcript_7679/m.26037 type:complete len:263 (+) Transcript_7679:88-876(+)
MTTRVDFSRAKVTALAPSGLRGLVPQAMPKNDGTLRLRVEGSVAAMQQVVLQLTNTGLPGNVVGVALVELQSMAGEPLAGPGEALVATAPPPLPKRTILVPRRVQLFDPTAGLCPRLPMPSLKLGAALLVAVEVLSEPAAGTVLALALPGAGWVVETAEQAVAVESAAEEQHSFDEEADGGKLEHWNVRAEVGARGQLEVHLLEAWEVAEGTEVTVVVPLRTRPAQLPEVPLRRFAVRAPHGKAAASGAQRPAAGAGTESMV